MSGEDIPHYRKTMRRGRSVVYTAEDTKQPKYFVAHEADDDGTTGFSVLPCLVPHKKPQSQMEG